MEGHDAYSKSLGDVLDLAPRTQDLFSIRVRKIFDSCLSLSSAEGRDGCERANYDALRLLSRFVNRRSTWLRKQNLSKYLSYGFPKAALVQEPQNCSQTEFEYIQKQNKAAREDREKKLGDLVDAALARLEKLDLIEFMWKDKGKEGVNLGPEDTITLIATTFTLEEVKKLAQKFGVITKQQGNNKGDLLQAIRSKALTQKDVLGGACFTALPKLCQDIVPGKVLRLKPLVKSSLRRLQRLHQCPSPDTPHEYDSSYVQEQGLTNLPLMVAFGMKKFPDYTLSPSFSFFDSQKQFERWEAAANLYDFLEKSKVSDVYLYVPGSLEKDIRCKGPAKELEEVVCHAMTAFELEGVELRGHLGVHPGHLGEAATLADLAVKIFERIGPPLSPLPSQEEADAGKHGEAALPLSAPLRDQHAHFSPGIAIMLVSVLCLVAEMHSKAESNEEEEEEEEEEGEEEEKKEKKRPEYLNCLEAGRRLAYITADCFAAFEYGGSDYHLALCLLSLLLTAGYCRHRRGRWYLRMCIDLEHLKRPADSLGVIERAGLLDPTIRMADRIALEQKQGKLRKKLKLKGKGATLKAKEQEQKPWLGLDGLDLSASSLVSHLLHLACPPERSQKRARTSFIFKGHRGLVCNQCGIIRPKGEKCDTCVPGTHTVTRGMGLAAEMLRRVEAVGEELGMRSIPAEDVLEAYYDPTFKFALQAQHMSAPAPLADETEAGGSDEEVEEAHEAQDDNVASEDGDIHSDLLHLLELDKATMRAAPDTVELVGRRYGDPSTRGKNRFICPNSDEKLSVEDWVMAHFHGKTDSSEMELHDDTPQPFRDLCRGHGGWVGWHSEGSQLRTLFGLLLWDTLFCNTVPGVFITAYQDAPLDFNYPSFFSSRYETHIRPRLETMRSWSTTKLLREISSSYRAHYGTDCRCVQWAHDLPSLQVIAAAIGSKGLAGVLLALSINFKAFNSGLPDLLMVRLARKKHPGVPVALQELQGWKRVMPLNEEPMALPTEVRDGLYDDTVPKQGANGDEVEGTGLEGDLEERVMSDSLPAASRYHYEGSDLLDGDLSDFSFEALLVEVKGPNDHLSEKQIVWLNIFKRHGVPAIVCKVKEPKDTTKKAKVRKRASETDLELICID